MNATTRFCTEEEYGKAMRAAARAEGHVARRPYGQDEMLRRRKSGQAGHRARGSKAPELQAAMVAKGEERRQQILRVLSGGEWLSTTIVADRVGNSRNNAGDRLRELLDAGLVEKRFVARDKGGRHVEWRLTRREAVE